MLYHMFSAPLNTFHNERIRVAHSPLHGYGVFANTPFHSGQVISGGTDDVVNGVWVATKVNSSHSLDLSNVTTTDELHHYLATRYYPQGHRDSNVDILAGTRAPPPGHNKVLQAVKDVAVGVELVRTYPLVEWYQQGLMGMHRGFSVREKALMGAYARELTGGARQPLIRDQWALEDPMVVALLS